MLDGQELATLAAMYSRPTKCQRRNTPVTQGLKVDSDPLPFHFSAINGYISPICERKKRKGWQNMIEARDLILQADSIARSKGLNQSQWASLSGYASNGQTVSRIVNRGECKLTTIVSLLDTLGCELRIVPKDET